MMASLRWAPSRRSSTPSSSTFSRVAGRPSVSARFMSSGSTANSAGGSA